MNLSKEKGKRMYPFTDEIVPIVNIQEGFLVINREAFGDLKQDTETNKEG